jgi:ABC-type sulfate/molybdate transport systems ATPase subunit
LFDDPVSALDVDVRKRIFTHVLDGRLKDKTRILATHAVDFLEIADRVVLMKAGRIDAIVSNKDIKNHAGIQEYLKCSQT